MIIWALLAWASGIAIGWNLKSFAVERRQCVWCDAPTPGPNQSHCARHALVVKQRLDEIGDTTP